MTLYLCTGSAFTIRTCQIMLADAIPFQLLKEKDLPAILKLSTYIDGLLLDYSEFSREEIETILAHADRRCKTALLMDTATLETHANEFRGRARCLDIFAPKEELQNELGNMLALNVRSRAEKRAEKKTGELSVKQTCLTDPLSAYKRKSFLERVQFIAQTKADLLLLGESGAGKSWLAEKIYSYSGRKGNFLSESLANISPALFESVLFGTVAGAYTDAVNKMGLLEATGEGTLFLDEIGELPLSLQSKLFSALDKRMFRRIGSIKEQPFEGRLIFATNKNLEEAVREKTFREELFHRISMVTIFVPPLREHPYDIPALASQFAQDEGKTLSAGALEKLCDYHYPGNIRELKNIVRRSCLLSCRTMLESKDIYFEHSL